jgi:hypothetical protein
MCSCLRTLPDEELTMTRTPYNGTDIKINGWYKGGRIYNNRCEYAFFYSNGVFLEFADLQNIENINQFTSGIDNIRKNKGVWGLYQIENNVIHVKRWASNDAAIQMVVASWTYNIINDTTLFAEYSKDDLRYYHFKHFSPKPDSTNVFIK